MLSLENKVLEKFKKHLNDKIATGQLKLILNNGFLPLFLYTTAEGVDEVEVDFEETSKDEAASIMREHCKNPNVIAVALMFCAYTLDQDLNDPKQKDRIIGDDIRYEKDTTESIMLYLYTKEKSEVRRIRYSKKDEQKDEAVNDYWFGDDGWVDITSGLSGRFSNPFMDLIA